MSGLLFLPWLPAHARHDELLVAGHVEEPRQRPPAPAVREPAAAQACDHLEEALAHARRAGLE
eukprot:8750001-Pyramimonas_sp.AAC.1